MWSPNELLKIEKQRDILSYITLQFFHFKKVPLEHCPFQTVPFLTLYGQTVKECYRHKIKPFFSHKISAISLPGNSSKR